MTTQPDYPTDKLVIKYPLCNGAVGGLIMGALAMHNELRFADNLLDIVFGAVGLVLVFHSCVSHMLGVLRLQVGGVVAVLHCNHHREVKKWNLGRFPLNHLSQIGDRIQWLPPEWW